MSSRVYFRFSSSTEFDSVTFEGEVITIGELNYLISKKTGVSKDRNTVVELFDRRTGEKYVDPSVKIAKNASVEAKRSPAVRPPPISVPVKTTAPAKKGETTEIQRPTPETKEEALDDGLGPGVFEPEPVTEPADDDAAISLLVKGLGEVWRTDLNLQSQWRRGRRDTGGRRGRGGMRMGRTNLPPMGYICHRCNTPGHFIDECPTNGDPAYDFVRVRYPTGIPSSMLEKDEEGGLAMPDGGRGRLRPNMEKFRREMEGVPTGEPTVKRLMAPTTTTDALMDPRFSELSAIIAGNPFATLAPLIQSLLPHAREVDIRQGFLTGRPFDRQTFTKRREEYDRAKDAFERSPMPPLTEWTPAPQCPRPPNYDSGQWRQPIPAEMHDNRSWPRKAVPYYPPVPGKPLPPFTDHSAAWHQPMQGYYDPTAYHRPFPPYIYHHPEQPIQQQQQQQQQPTSVSQSPPAVPSTVVRIGETLVQKAVPAGENGTQSIEFRSHSPKELPYGFSKTPLRRSPPAELEDRVQLLNNTRSRSRSPERLGRRKSEHRESSNRSTSSTKGFKSHKSSKDKSHSRRKEKDRRINRRDTLEKPSPNHEERDAKRHREVHPAPKFTLRPHHPYLYRTVEWIDGNWKAVSDGRMVIFTRQNRLTVVGGYHPTADAWMVIAVFCRDRYERLDGKRLAKNHTDKERRFES